MECGGGGVPIKACSGNIACDFMQKDCQQTKMLTNITFYSFFALFFCARFNIKLKQWFKTF